MRISAPRAVRLPAYASLRRLEASARPGLLLVAVLAVLAVPACSVKRMAINSMADTLASAGDVFASDNDPELVRDAVPFSLKTIESLLVSVPNHRGLLLAACSGFTQYAYAFVQTDAELIEAKDYRASVEGKDRALKLYLRARDYCVRHLELRHRGIKPRLVKDPNAALVGATRADVPVLYWTGASWGAAISLGLDRPELIADLPVVRAFMDRALELDETYSRGAIHEALISLEAVPEVMGGSPQRARQHFERAVELSKGQSAGPYVTLASSVSVAAQDRVEFERLLNQALAIDVDKDPTLRLANIITQRRARFLLESANDLFALNETHSKKRLAISTFAPILQEGLAPPIFPMSMRCHDETTRVLGNFRPALLRDGP